MPSSYTGALGGMHVVVRSSYMFHVVFFKHHLVVAKLEVSSLWV